jgi:hypothetical protein
MSAVSGAGPRFASSDCMLDSFRIDRLGRDLLAGARLRRITVVFVAGACIMVVALLLLAAFGVLERLAIAVGAAV